MNNKIPKKHLRKYPLEITERGEPHYVYFIVTCPSDTREERRVKIGKSETEEGVYNRFSTANTYCPIEIKLLGFLKGYERDWHEYFKNYRIKGEWFNFKDIKHYLSKIKLQIPKILLDDEKERLQNANFILKSDTNEVTDLKLLESKKIKDARYVTDRYQTRVLANRDFFNWHEYTKDEEYEQECLDNVDHICKLLNLLGFGKMDTNLLWHNKVVQVVTAATSKIDMFNNCINEGEIYFRTDPNYNQGEAYGVSIRNGQQIFNIFKNFMKVRNHDFYTTFGSGARERKASNKIEEKVDLFNIINLMASKIERELKKESYYEKNN